MSTKHTDRAGAPVRVALVASERREFDGVLRHLGGARTAGDKIPAKLRFGRVLLADGVEWTLVADGQGAAAATRACHAIPAPETLSAIGSIGYCGATQPHWRIGDVLRAASVNDRSTGEQFACHPTEGSGATFPSANILTVERVIRFATEKRRIGDTGIDAVEMEASAVARFASTWRLRFFALKAVSDLSDEDLPVDFEAARATDGSIRLRSVLAQTVSQPWYRLPRLGKLARAASVASDNLGAAIAALRIQ